MQVSASGSRVMVRCCHRKRAFMLIFLNGAKEWMSWVSWRKRLNRVFHVKQPRAMICAFSSAATSNDHVQVA